MVLPFGSMVFEPHVSSDDLEAYSLGLSNLSIAGRLAVVIGGGMPVAAIRPAPISRQQASCSAPPNSRLPDMPDVAFGMMLIAGGVLVTALYSRVAEGAASEERTHEPGPALLRAGGERRAGQCCETSPGRLNQTSSTASCC
jgi:hypothetical protein